jgi:hypothetical protein
VGAGRREDDAAGLVEVRDDVDPMLELDDSLEIPATVCRGGGEGRGGGNLLHQEPPHLHEHAQTHGSLMPCKHVETR